MKTTTIELVIKRDGVAAAARELEQMGSRGEAAANRVRSAFSATDRATTQLTQQMNRYQDVVTKTGVSGAQGFNALREPLTAVTRQLLNLNPAVAQVSSSLGMFAIGSGPMVAVLAGVAALAAVWENVTRSTRDAKKAADEAMVRLDELAAKQKQGPAGSTPGDVGQAWKRALEIRKEIGANTARIGNIQGQSSISNAGQIALNDLRAANEALIAEHTKMVARIRAGGMELNRVQGEADEKMMSDAKQRREQKKAADDAWYRDWIAGVKKASADIARAAGVVGTTQSVGDGAAARTAARDAQQRAASKSAHEERYQAQLKEFEQEARDHQQKMDDIAKEKAARRNALKELAINSGLQIMGTVGGAKGQLASGVISSAMQGFAATGGNPLGAVIGGVTALTTGLFTMGKAAKEAADRVRAAQVEFQASFALYKKGAYGTVTDLDQQLEAERQRYSQYEQQIQTLYGGKKNESERDKLLADAKRAHEQYIAQIKATAAEMEKAGKADGFRKSIEEFTSVIDNLHGFRSSIALGTLSVLSPMQKLAEARRQYDEVLGKARGGDITAGNQLPQVAQQLLGIAREGYASGAGYQQIYQMVMKDNDEISKLFEAQRTIAQQQLDVLTGIRNGLVEVAKKEQENHEATIEVLDRIADSTARQGERPEKWDYAI